MFVVDEAALKLIEFKITEPSTVSLYTNIFLDIKYFRNRKSSLACLFVSHICEGYY